MEKIMQACNRITDWFKIKTLSANPKKFQVMNMGKMINPINSLVTHNVDVKPKTTIKMRDYEQHFFPQAANYKNGPYM